MVKPGEQRPPQNHSDLGTRNSELFHITSPETGDRYRIPPGVEGRYATIALRAAGIPAGRRVRWYVDGKPAQSERWSLIAGRHKLRAESGSVSDEVEFVVE
jgi:hypothetical protein